MTTTDVTNEDLRDAALAGLRQRPKGLSPKWFYDERGSALFEQITELPEYYPSRTERGILETRLSEIASFVPDGAVLVELGSGASVKTRLLLDGLPQLSAYIPVDISEGFLLETAATLQSAYPALAIRPVVADFTADVELPDLKGAPCVGFFPGSTLGNLDPANAEGLLRRLREWPRHTALVLGLDLVKAPETLEAAYDDASGVTAAFNLNLLRRLNREAGARFDLEAFRHRAIFNAEAARVEMHLESQRDQIVQIAGHEIEFAAGETIHTENSHKFTRDRVNQLAERSGWEVALWLTDPDALFTVTVLRPA